MSLTQEQVNALLAQSTPEWVPVLRRLLPRVTVSTDGCWLFGGALSNGYGVIGRGGRGAGNVLAHRATYAALTGPLVDGLHLDHLCRVTACCNPAHLEQVTPAVNHHRSTSAAVLRQKYAAQTHCKNGHEFTPENTYYGRRGPYRTRQCRTCTSRPARRARKAVSV